MSYLIISYINIYYIYTEFLCTIILTYGTFCWYLELDRRNGRLGLWFIQVYDFDMMQLASRQPAGVGTQVHYVGCCFGTGFSLLPRSSSLQRAEPVGTCGNHLRGKDDTLACGDWWCLNSVAWHKRFGSWCLRQYVQDDASKYVGPRKGPEPLLSSIPVPTIWEVPLTDQCTHRRNLQVGIFGEESLLSIVVKLETSLVKVWQYLTFVSGNGLEFSTNIGSMVLSDCNANCGEFHGSAEPGLTRKWWRLRKETHAQWAFLPPVNGWQWNIHNHPHVQWCPQKP